jgi:hypothetical protein
LIIFNGKFFDKILCNAKRFQNIAKFHEIRQPFLLALCYVSQKFVIIGFLTVEI